MPLTWNIHNPKSLPREARSLLHRGKIQKGKSEIQNPKSKIPARHRSRPSAIGFASGERRAGSGEAGGQNLKSGILYVVSTPIGNLEDITLRGLRILKEVDLIAAEGVSHSRKLCQNHGIKTKLMSYNQHNQRRRGPELIRRLKSGLDVALVTNAGTPGVSDPGALLIHQAVEEGIKVSPIPGPSAVISALSVSGLRAERFLFLGFLSHKSSKRRNELKNLISEKRTMVFFEAPHRLQAMLMDLKDILGDRHIVLLREMTKVFEEIKRGLASAVLRQLEPDNVKGEFTLVVAGREKNVEEGSIDKETQRRIEKLLRENNLSVKDVAAQVSEEKGFTYRRLYKACLSIKRALRPSGEGN